MRSLPSARSATYISTVKNDGQNVYLMINEERKCKQTKSNKGLQQNSIAFIQKELSLKIYY